MYFKAGLAITIELDEIRRLLMNNAIKYVKILESTGVSREQAEAHVQVLTDFLEGDLATKEDVINSERTMSFLEVNEKVFSVSI